jgi:hypothetical protein
VIPIRAWLLWHMRRIVMTARGPLIFSSSQRSKLGSGRIAEGQGVARLGLGSAVAGDRSCDTAQKRSSLQVPVGHKHSSAASPVSWA